MTDEQKIKDLHKKNETIFDLARRFPNKTYRELEKYRDADRQEEAAQIPMTDSQKDLVKDGGEIHRLHLTSKAQQEILRNTQEELANIKKRNSELEAINKHHQKLNGELQEKLSRYENKAAHFRRKGVL